MTTPQFSVLQVGNKYVVTKNGGIVLQARSSEAAFAFIEGYNAANRIIPDGIANLIKEMTAAKDHIERGIALLKSSGRVIAEDFESLRDKLTDEIVALQCPQKDAA